MTKRARGIIIIISKANNIIALQTAKAEKKVFMYWIADILMLVFVGVLLYRGIKRGLTNTFLTLITAILWIVLAIGVSFALVFFVLKPLGVMQDVSNAFLGAGNELYSFLGSLGITGIALPEIEAIDIFAGVGFESVELTGYILAQYLGYLLFFVLFFIPLYIFFLWVGKKFEQFVAWVRGRNGFLRVIGSILGGLVNGAFACVIVLGVYWLVSALDGSGLFSYTNEVLRAAPISGIIYEHNPLYSILGGHGNLAETVGSLISGDFLKK